MRFSLEYPADGEPGFEIVEAQADADFAIVDADSPAAVRAAALEGRTARALFVGATPPAEAPIVMPRPLDLARVRRSLARLMARHGAESWGTESPSSLDDPDEIIVFEPQMLAHMGQLPTRPEELPRMPDEDAAVAPVVRPAARPIAPPVSWAITMPPELELEPEPERDPEPVPFEPLELPRLPGAHEVFSLSDIPVIADGPPSGAGSGASGLPTIPPMPELPVLGRAARTPEARPAPAEPPSEFVQREKKAAARAAARHARITHNQTDPGELENLRDVMVLDADTGAAEELRELLDLFGFRVHVAHHIAQAADVLSRHALVAAFVDVPVNGADQGDGVTLLQTIQDLPKLVGHATPPVLLVSGPLRPSDQVRARLAGVNMHIQKPVSRGAVARALEGCQVVLPADARRSI
ncbi:MAG TPA: response regulator [Burkholderiaceae bacterium]